MNQSFLIFVGSVVFIAIQLCLFAGYHFNITQLEEEGNVEHELQQQLRSLIDENREMKVNSETLQAELDQERAKQRGLQLQLLRSGQLPHTLRLSGLSSYPKLEKEMQAQVEALRKASGGQHKAYEEVAARLLEGGRPQASAASLTGTAAAPGGQLPRRDLSRQETVRQLLRRDGGRAVPPGNEDGACTAQEDPGAQRAVAGVVVVAFNRPEYLEKTLGSILTAWRKNPSWEAKFPLHVSQDGTHAGVKSTVLRHSEFKHLNHIESKAPQPLNKKENVAYYRIANHYKFILFTMFDCLGYRKAIILEDDMQLSLDFFEYFEATSRLLDEDKSLYTVSSWNDHGQSQFVSNASQIYRSDFFPGLGWMLTRELWNELRPSWPRAYWDDWMRQSNVRKGRQSIRPEVCRTYNFGEKGSSHGQFYRKYIATTHLNDEYVHFMDMDLGYLKQDRYKEWWEELTANAPAMDVEKAKAASGPVKVLYGSQEEYEGITGKLGMLREWKDGVPRGAYEGVVPIRFNKAHIFIMPKPNFRPTARLTGQVDQTGALVKKKPTRNLRRF
uniref:Alpha-1,3-mannosyl-glycoprotein 2-beta-N-acetylglucosaminyltransferase n=2 Tax=Tetraselmis sp. GSL018 TaxID=582737 RepID=A0A061QS26_9CHLO|mmetsp:Transcript_12318/g.29251  ORF Transcript_12318/g.29251 Transcript_12318/m.29251 type:complete len:557 (+) Transcript_12318:453-2123(+)